LKNLTKILKDIEKGEASPVVDGSLKHYIPWYLDKRKSDQTHGSSKVRKIDLTPAKVSAYPPV
jgi:hypothetical protein